MGVAPTAIELQAILGLLPVGQKAGDEAKARALPVIRSGLTLHLKFDLGVGCSGWLSAKSPSLARQRGRLGGALA